MHANKIYNLIFEAVITLGTLERHVVTVHNFLVRPQRVFRLELLVTDLTRHRLSQRPDTKAQKLGTSTNFDKMKEKDVDIQGDFFNWSRLKSSKCWRWQNPKKVKVRVSHRENMKL